MTKRNKDHWARNHNTYSQYDLRLDLLKILRMRTTTAENISNWPIFISLNTSLCWPRSQSKIKTIGHATASDTLIISYVHFFHLCSNLLPVTSSKHVYILTFGWSFWNFKISGCSHIGIPYDSRLKWKFLLFVKSITNNILDVRFHQNIRLLRSCKKKRLLRPYPKRKTRLVFN